MNKIVQKSKNLILNENWSIIRCSKTFGCSVIWLANELKKLNIPRLTNIVESTLSSTSNNNQNNKGVPVNTTSTESDHPDNPYYINGQIIRNWRIYNNLNQKEISNKIGCHSSVISNMELNKKNTGSVYYKAILDLAGMTKDDFIKKYSFDNNLNKKIYAKSDLCDNKIPTTKKGLLEAYHRHEKNYIAMKESAEAKIRELNNTIKELKANMAKELSEKDKIINELKNSRVNGVNNIDNSEYEAKFNKLKEVSSKILDIPSIITDNNYEKTIDTFKEIIKRLI